MICSDKIYHRPYLPLNRHGELSNPYVCRIAPFEDGAEFEWFDYGSDGNHTLHYGKRGSEDKTVINITDSVVVLSDLEKNTEYEFYIESDIGKKSKTRLFRTGSIPEGCSVINYLHPEDPFYDFSGKFLCSPSLARVKSGRLIAGMDIYGLRMAQNYTILFYSDDDGKSWRYLTDLYPFYWASMFVHKDVLYILGLTTEYGNLQVSCSRDEGKTWEVPKTIMYGSNFTCKYGGVHRAPMQIVKHNGRLYTSFEYGCWEMGSHLPMVLSVDENADLMNPQNWVASELLPFDGAWKEKAVEQKDTIEGNIVVAPDGNMYNFMRWKVGSMLKLKVNKDDPNAPLEFADIVEAPVSNSMFKIIRDGDRYVMITNRKTEKSAQYEHWTYRNVLSVYESKDLESFTFVKDIFNMENEHPKKNGFQYPAFLYENGEILLSVRSAFNEPNSEHDSNYMLFCKI